MGAVRSDAATGRSSGPAGQPRSRYSRRSSARPADGSRREGDRPRPSRRTSPPGGRGVPATRQAARAVSAGPWHGPIWRTTFARHTCLRALPLRARENGFFRFGPCHLCPPLRFLPSAVQSVERVQRDNASIRFPLADSPLSGTTPRTGSGAGSVRTSRSRLSPSRSPVRRRRP